MYNFVCVPLYISLSPSHSFSLSVLIYVLQDGKGVWRCIQKRCSARCKSFDKDPEAGIAWARLEHTHDQDSQASIERQQIRTVCKRKAVDDISERPSKIILTELTNRPDGELVPKDVKAVRQSIYRERRKLQPKLPTCRAEVHEALRDRNITSNDGEEMLQFNNERTGIILFTTLKNLQFLCQDDVEVFGDGTFEFCPKFFYQLYTIHGYKNGHYLPCAFFLLQSKTKNCYRDMFAVLIETCSRMSLNLEISSIHLDFEIAVHEVIKEFFPNAEIKGCNFHLAQAWYRKIQQLGLAPTYKEDTPSGRWLKNFFGLMFLGEEEVGDFFAFHMMPECPDGPGFESFADYVCQTYIDGPFPPAMWASRDLTRKKTTNACERFHREFGDMFYSPHPSIFAFMDKLKLQQSKTYMKIRAANSGVLALTRRDVEKQNTLLEIQAAYEHGAIAQSDYVWRLALRYQPVRM